MANKYRSVLASAGTQPTGNAVPADVLSGKTFSNADGIDKVGTMVNRGAVSGTATPSQPYTIPAGYHNGSGVVSASASSAETFTVTSASPSVTLNENHSEIFMCVYSTDAYTLSQNGTILTGAGAFQRLISGDNTGCVVIKYEGTFNSGDTITAGGYTAGFPVFLICV